MNMPATTTPYARNGLVVIPDEKALGRSRILLRRGPTDYVDISHYVCRVETIRQVNDVDKHVVTFYSGVMPDGEQA
jgi:hypothetical protein